MPWDIRRKGTEYCVYDKNGKELKCYSNRAQALAYQKALYANVDDISKELIGELIESGEESIATISKQGDRYRIVAVSTAAIEDRQRETFTTQAMDYDIAEAYKSGQFPEFRVFHSPALGIGRVDTMRRVGIFAIDEGYSYTDPFSLATCKDLLANNQDGKWRTSRGFKAIEVAAGCPGCGSELVINKSHMVAGYRCPACTQVHLSFKGKPNVRYLKARTFDVSVTDVPVVPMTSAAAFIEMNTLEDSMTKKQLKERLLSAGLDEAVVDARLSQVTDEQLKEFDDVPDATLLKELDLQEKDDDSGDSVDFAELVDAIRTVVKEEVISVMSEFEIELPSIELKEISELTQLKEEIAELKEQIEALLEQQEEITKEWTPRGGKKRVPRILKGKKVAPPVEDGEEDEEDEEDDEDMEAVVAKGWFSHFAEDPNGQQVAIRDGAGKTYKSLSEFVNA